MKKLIYLFAAGISLLMSSCDIEMIPKGKTTLSTTKELEYLLNTFQVSTDPAIDMGVIVNECYFESEFVTVDQLIANTNSLQSAYISYNESVDREALSARDYRYNSIYSDVNTMNVIIGKADESDGSEALKAQIKGEAHLKRAYLHLLAANIYAAQYDEATAAQKGGIAYVTDYTMENKEQLPLDQVYALMLQDVDDSYIEALPDKAASTVRCSKATGYAIKARVLFQMKRYAEALPYAEMAVKLHPQMEDRSSVVETQQWAPLSTEENNLLYISPISTAFSCPFWECLSIETVNLFEHGDYVLDYAIEYGMPLWSDFYGLLYAAPGARIFAGMDAEITPYGITTERMKYLLAECYIRTGKISEGMKQINEVRKMRIHPDYYQDFTASNEQEAMQLLQRAKFIECIATCENFFDRKRWNTEEKYRKTIVRDIPGIGTYSISPESPLWILPIPAPVMNVNPSFKQNF